MDSFIIKKRTKTRTDNGNEFLYNKKPNTSQAINFFKKQIIVNNDLKNAEPGLYTWILRESGNIYASKTLTKQEIGTLHINLKLLTDSEDPTNIYAAGELEIINEEGINTIIFNLLSGTYMATKFKSLSNANRLLLRNSIVTNVISVINGFGISSQFLECSAISCSDEEKIGGMMLIENANIRTNVNTLSKLNEMFVRKYGGRTKRNYKKNNRTRRMRK